MNFLVLQHLDIEPPALIGDILIESGHRLTTIHLDQDEILPDARGYDGLIIMGGPQSANDKSNEIRNELKWTRHALAHGLPMLGICLGAQIMAKAAGADILPSPVRELGWHPVFTTAAAAKDPLFRSIGTPMQVFQWHGETFSECTGMTMLASHPDVPAQAFRLGAGQYGLQFHAEVDHEIIEQWIAYGESERAHLQSSGIAQIRSQHKAYLEPARKFCTALVHAWLEEITKRRA